MTIPSQAAPPYLFGFPQYRQQQPLADATRYLASAPYLDSQFANTVIEKVVEDEHRAVAPSWDFDLDPVIRHCFRARRLLLARDATVAAMVLIGLCLSTFLTIAWLLIGLTILGVRTSFIRSLPLAHRIGFIGLLIAAALTMLCCGGFWQIFESMNLLGGGPLGSDQFGSDPFAPEQESDLLVQGSTGIRLVAPLVLTLATFAVLFGFRLKAYTVITSELAAGRSGPHPGLANDRIARRVATVAAAQYGNIGYQERAPFLGAGIVNRMWSFALRLQPASAAGPVDAPASASTAPADGSGVDDRTGGRVLPLDELGPALNQRVREVVQRMSGEDLPPGVRVPNLHLAPFLLADGTRAKGDPLLAPDAMVPYPLAYPEAVEAIVRHPQAGLRYYQRVVVSGPGKPVHTAAGLPVLPPQNLPITISAFIHVAVEGGRLYTEFVATVMPPVRARYTLADGLRPERTMAWALRDALRHFPSDTAASGWRALRSAWRIVTTGWRMEQARQASQELRVHDYGAQLSVRQFGAEPELENYLHMLDDEKYVKLVERAVVEAVAECLHEHGYDTAEFRERANHVQNVNIYGGQQSFGGERSTFHQHNQPAGSTA